MKISNELQKKLMLRIKSGETKNTPAMKEIPLKYEAEASDPAEPDKRSKTLMASDTRNRPTVMVYIHSKSKGKNVSVTKTKYQSFAVVVSHQAAAGIKSPLYTLTYTLETPNADCGEMEDGEIEEAGQPQKEVATMYFFSTVTTLLKHINDNLIMTSPKTTALACFEDGDDSSDADDISHHIRLLFTK
jgi:hypothetical protein